MTAKTVAERNKKLRDSKKASGLVKVEVWVKPKYVDAVKRRERHEQWWGLEGYFS